MKFLLILFFCVCIVSISFGLRDFSQDNNDIKISRSISENPIDKLWKQALEFIRALLKKYQPFQVPDMPEQTVTGDGISLKAKFSKVMVSNAENFVIDKLENNILGLWAKYQVTEPTINIKGGYRVTGTVKGKSVSGNGQFSVGVEKMVVNGYIKVSFKGTYLQMSQFDMNYSMQHLTFNETGLEIEGMTQQEIKKMFDKSFNDYFKNNEEFVCSQISVYVMEQANKIMKDKSLQGLLDWLKDFIDGKIIPNYNM